MKLQITLKKSPIACLQVQKDTVAALGLRKIGQTVTREDNPCVRGQIFRVRHMLEVTEIQEEATKKAAKKPAAAKAPKAQEIEGPKAPKAKKPEEIEGSKTPKAPVEM